MVAVKYFPENTYFPKMLISGKGKYFSVFGCILKNFPENIFWCLEKKKENTNPSKIPSTIAIWDRDLAGAISRSTARARASDRDRRRDLAPSRDRAVDRDQRHDLATRRSRDLAVASSRRVNREIMSLIARSRRRDRNLESRSLMIFFLGLCFPSSFLNTRKYFPENFLKCNQTQRNIFLFWKLAFLENMYFPENVLRQPNTA